MLILRKAQLHALERVSFEQCIVDLADSVDSFAPQLAKVMGKRGCLDLAKSAAATAETEDFKLRGSIRLIMQLITTLGRAFMNDPQLPWAREILNHVRGRAETDRIGFLYSRALAYLDEVHGPRNIHLFDALHRLLDLGESGLRAPAGANADDFIRLAARIFPEKQAFVSGRAMRSVYSEAQAAATRFGLGGDAVMLLAGLAFALGSGIAQDPCYPWIAHTLRHPKFGDGPRRTDRLFKRVNIYLYSVTRYLTAKGEDHARRP